MKRIGRYILNGFTVLSLLLCMATVVLWVRSYWVCDVIVRRIGRGTNGVWLVKGNILWQDYWFDRLGVSGQRGWHLKSVSVQQAGGFGGNNPFFHPTSVPLWLPLFLMVQPLWLGKRKSFPDHCASCGYDLRATPDRCPECGTVPNNSK